MSMHVTFRLQDQFKHSAAKPLSATPELKPLANLMATYKAKVKTREQFRQDLEAAGDPGNMADILDEGRSFAQGRGRVWVELNRHATIGQLDDFITSLQAEPVKHLVEGLSIELDGLNKLNAKTVKPPLGINLSPRR